MFDYFGSKVAAKSLSFLQETHSSAEAEKQQNDKSKGQLYFSHGKTSSCGVLTGFYGNINILIKKQLNGKGERISILEIRIDKTEYLQINIYNANAE